MLIASFIDVQLPSWLDVVERAALPACAEGRQARSSISPVEQARQKATDDFVLPQHALLYLSRLM